MGCGAAGSGQRALALKTRRSTALWALVGGIAQGAAALDADVGGHALFIAQRARQHDDNDEKDGQDAWEE